MGLQKKTFFFFLVGLFALILVSSALATEVDWPGSIFTGQSLNQDSEFHDFIAYIYGWGIQLGVIIVFAMLVFSGFQYMTSAGSPQKMGEALTRIRTVLWGLLLLLSSWLVLNTINPQITRIIALPPVWDPYMLEKGVVLTADQLQEPPCAFVLLYGRTDFQGSAKRVVPPFTEKSKIDFKSVKSFRELTEQEKEMISEAEEAGIDHGREIREGRYVDGNSCLITVYEKSKTGFLTWSPCGKSVGAFSSSTPNIVSFISGDPEDTSCYTVENVSRKKSQ